VSTSRVATRRVPTLRVPTLRVPNLGVSTLRLSTSRAEVKVRARRAEMVAHAPKARPYRTLEAFLPQRHFSPRFPKKLRPPASAVRNMSLKARLMVTSAEGTAVRVQEDLGQPAQGEIPAFAEIVRGQQGMVFSLAYYFLRDRSLAEELAQEVFLELHRHLATIESPAHLVFWLRKVTSRRCIDQTRRRAFWPKFRLDDVPEPAARTPDADPLLSRTLARLVASLPEKPRLVVILRFQEDLDPAEIAEVLDMPVSTVKSHLQRSLAMLRDKLARTLGEIAI
jgi:RNA polymerase sigma-70 factor, ECF subfamily